MKSDNMKKFYQLYIVRNEAGESTADIGKLIGLSKLSYWNRENGKTPFTLPEAFTLVQHYGKSVEELFPETLLIKKPHTRNEYAAKERTNFIQPFFMSV